jgi:hypothetical protein
MNDTEEMSYLKAKRGYGSSLHNTTHLVGRPKGSGNLKLPDYKATIPAKLSPILVEMIEVERKVNESYADTLLRMLRHRTNRIADIQKKYDALVERHSTLSLEVNNLSQ